MASIASSSYLPALAEPHERAAVSHELRATLHELVALALIGKQLHWAVVGKQFWSLHHQLDEFVDTWRELADTVAERAVALGYIPDGQAQAVADSAVVAPITPAPVEDKAVVRELSARLAMSSERTRERMVRVGELDLASQDVLIEVLRSLEQQQWMLRAQLGQAATVLARGQRRDAAPPSQHAVASEPGVDSR